MEDKVEIRPEVQSFAGLMEQVLRTNDPKGDLENCSLAYLLSRMYDGVDEVKTEIVTYTNARLRYPHMVKDLERLEDSIKKECADVANFAMMIADAFSR